MKLPLVSRKEYDRLRFEYAQIVCRLNSDTIKTIEEMKVMHQKEIDRITADLPEILRKLSNVSLAKDSISGESYRLCIDIRMKEITESLMWGNDSYWIERIAETMKRKIIESLSALNCMRNPDLTDRRGYPNNLY